MDFYHNEDTVSSLLQNEHSSDSEKSEDVCVNSKYCNEALFNHVYFGSYSIFTLEHVYHSSLFENPTENNIEICLFVSGSAFPDANKI